VNEPCCRFAPLNLPAVCRKPQLVQDEDHPKNQMNQEDRMDLDLPDMAAENRTFVRISGQVVKMSKENACVKSGPEIFSHSGGQ